MVLFRAKYWRFVTGYAGLGTRAGRSLQRQFDEAVACLRAVHGTLVTTLAITAAPQPPAAAGITSNSDMPVSSAAKAGAAHVSAAAQRGERSAALSFASGTELCSAVAIKLAEWEAVVVSHQSASRVLKWSAPS